MTQMKQAHLSFRVGTQWYGLPLDEVVEILPMMMLTELPDTKSGAVWLMNLRGKVVHVIDLRLRLGIAQPEYTLDTPIVTVQTSRGMVGFMVDDADTVERLAEVDSISYQGTESAYVRGAARL